ncbi:MAG: PadR family transcriptional regulator [Thermomicrobiales bacterium]
MAEVPGKNVGASRFADAGLLILISLADGEKHGYAMISDIEEIADVKLGPGTLYTALARLEGQGLIEPVETDDRRKPYRLTPDGRAELSAQLAGMEGLAAMGQQRMETA